MPTTRDKSLTVLVDHEPWAEARTLADAGPDDKIFVVDPAGAVVFGDGVHGRRPPADSAVSVSYRTGAGRAGNAAVSATVRWPPPEGRYLVELSSGRIRIAASDEIVEHYCGARRPDFFSGQVLSADDLRDEQEYLVRKQHRHNRALHGPGIVGGLTVDMGDPPSPSIVVKPGFALDRQGRELELCTSASLSLRARRRVLRDRRVHGAGSR